MQTASYADSIGDLKEQKGRGDTNGIVSNIPPFEDVTVGVHKVLC